MNCPLSRCYESFVDDICDSLPFFDSVEFLRQDQVIH